MYPLGTLIPGLLTCRKCKSRLFTSFFILFVPWYEFAMHHCLDLQKMNQVLLEKLSSIPLVLL